LVSAWKGQKALYRYFTGRLEPDTQMGFGVIQDRIQIRHGFDVVVGGHGGIYPAIAGCVKMDLAGSGMVVGWPAGELVPGVDGTIRVIILLHTKTDPARY
jgi:hypothetical protein